MDEAVWSAAALSTTPQVAACFIPITSSYSVALSVSSTKGVGVCVGVGVSVGVGVGERWSEGLGAGVERE